MNRAERQAATRRMHKCACGNVAGYKQNRCGRCRDRAERAAQKEIARLTAQLHQINGSPLCTPR